LWVYRRAHRGTRHEYKVRHRTEGRGTGRFEASEEREKAHEKTTSGRKQDQIGQQVFSEIERVLKRSAWRIIHNIKRTKKISFP